MNLTQFIAGLLYEAAILHYIDAVDTEDTWFEARMVLLDASEE